MKQGIIIGKDLIIPLSELKFQFSRSGGHGGQNVNKVESRVELIFDALHSPSLTGAQLDLIKKNLGSRIGADGNIRIVSVKSRYQWRNRQDAVAKFIVMLQKGLVRKKKRIPTKTTEAGREKRLEEKKLRSGIKKMRKAGID